MTKIKKLGGKMTIADKMTDWVLNTIEKLLPDPKTYCKNCGRELIWWGNMERGKWIECECKDN